MEKVGLSMGSVSEASYPQAFLVLFAMREHLVIVIRGVGNVGNRCMQQHKYKTTVSPNGRNVKENRWIFVLVTCG